MARKGPKTLWFSGRPEGRFARGLIQFAPWGLYRFRFRKSHMAFIRDHTCWGARGPWSEPG